MVSDTAAWDSLSTDQAPRPSPCVHVPSPFSGPTCPREEPMPWISSTRPAPSDPPITSDPIRSHWQVLGLIDRLCGDMPQGSADGGDSGADSSNLAQYMQSGDVNDSFEQQLFKPSLNPFGPPSAVPVRVPQHSELAHSPSSTATLPLLPNMLAEAPALPLSQQLMQPQQPQQLQAPQLSLPPASQPPQHLPKSFTAIGAPPLPPGRSQQADPAERLDPVPLQRTGISGALAPAR